VRRRSRASPLSSETSRSAARFQLAWFQQWTEHLEDLRRRLIWSVVFVGAAFGVCWFGAAELLEVAKAPILAANPNVTLSLSRAQDILSLNVKVTLVAALFLSSPFVLAQALTPIIDTGEYLSLFLTIVVAGSSGGHGSTPCADSE
jgi:Sec-independent protein secretion pathway component TatC